ncbi:MAG: hypothetical protein HQL96_14690 [Magnetococcales bacterium]|nr:hypothetical protein [Magnetococcales bacterium]
MSGLFIIDPQWEPTDHGPEEIRQTSALLRIKVNNRLATRVHNDWAKSVHETVRLSAYPLALWLAASWWRLRWEPVPTNMPDVDWRMAHEMGSAGHGYLWPPMRIETDGESVVVHSLPSSEDATEPIRYLSHFRESIPAFEFAKGVEMFIQTVIARLDTVGIGETPLHALWKEVTQESANAEAASYRKMEALLGYDPDEAPEGVVDALQQLFPEAGEAAVAEIAAACASGEPGQWMASLRSESQRSGVPGSLGVIGGIKNALTRDIRFVAAPWERGRAMARAAREHLGLDGQPVSDKRLGEILEITEQSLSGKETPMSNLSLAVRSDDSTQVNLLFRRSVITGRRFEMARWIADALMAPGLDHWLPATDAKTARQKVQRAFAAEFLAPINALQAFLGHDLTDDERIEEAGVYFRVSPLAIRSHLDNHGLRIHYD